ncbi:DENN domain type RAB GEF [Caenorhabditis elegans]|uniref:DENN domain type RAB GEF n=1 Tax=Caenorhabditis elegans TaxID=6239 RepID=U4PB94_CAEEL|nr:DENN domain type RAB GEF [Caenorhabditis elegans]CDH93122.1 DENN domain type RAB GEF [Caenorhabditis elegans]|eukprot:NP_001294391.1 DENN domain type RAB GEF [Caenorhabditis elegans]
MSSGAGLTGSHDERRLFEHFVIAGLAENQPLERLKPSSEECGLRNTQPLAPITDIAVIFPSLGEKPPDGFDVIESTTLGYPADLNHGSIGQKSVFLCYKRGYNKLPLVDIGILDEGRGDKPMIDSNVVQTTPFGRCASVNNASQGIYLTYRRAPPNSSQSQFVVTDIKVILANKGEIPPHTYYKITKNLNKGLVGSDVFICYKKSQGTAKRLAYKPAVLDYFPRSDHSGEMEDFKLAQNVAMFCLPMGALIECWPTKCAPPDRSFSTFVLTDENGTKFYGSAVTFYEKYTKQLSEDQLEQLDLKSDEGGTVEDSGSNNDPADDLQILFYKNVSICLISRFPFFNSFKRFLFFLHRMSSTPSCSHPVPIERYISHLMYEVSFPTPRRPRVFMQLGAENISFDSHDDSQLPLNGAQLIDTLKYLGSENLMYLMLLALLEQKILIHSLRPWMLAAVAESVCALMFPFHWQCPYIPQCPLGLAGVLHAPLPFIAGVDSRYFELYEDPPDDVTCFDLDTSTISFSTVRATFKTSMLPKKPAKQLKSALEDIFGKLQKQDYSTNSKSDGGFIPVDQDLVKQRQRREFENEIHDAFLKFIASIMKGYQAFLRPIKGAPMTEHATDTGNLFDLDGFLRSRDRSSADFYKRFSETQSFMRFIEERSFVSDKNTYNAFFDDCIAKLTSAVEDGRDISGVQLLEPDTSHSHTTSTINALADTRTSMVFIPAPEPFLNQETGEELQFVYGEFPSKMRSEYFQLDRLEKNGKDGEKVPMHFEASRCSAVRTKPETRSSLLAATNAVKTNPLHWSKTLLFYSYSLWFMQLDSLLTAAPNKKKILRLAFNVLDRMEKTEIFPLDQVCYRILIELCGKYSEPEMAVKVMRAMQRAGLEQNAVTYGIYHRAVMDATWPSPARQKAIKMWNLLRIVLTGAETLRKWANLERRPLKIDEKSVENTENAENVQAEITVDYQITSYPLDSVENSPKMTPKRHNLEQKEPLMDPLGALGPLEAENLEVSREKTKERSKSLGKVGMSPARAKFFADHATLPFSNENTPKSDKKEAKSGWFKGIANSPMFKMIKSTTFDSSKQNSAESSSETSSITGASPSFHSVVNQFKKGYDDVMPSRFRLGVSTLLNKSVGAMGSGMIYSDDRASAENPFFVNPKDPAYVLDSGVPNCLLREEYWMREVYLQLKRSRERVEKGQKSEENEEISDGIADFPQFSAKTPGKLEVILCTATYCPSCRTMVYDEEIMAGWKVDDQNLNTICPHCSGSGTATDAVSNETAAIQESVFAPRLKIRMRWIEEMKSSWYQPGGLQETPISTPEKTTSTPSDIQLEVAFVSPLVLRRELETLLSTDKDAMRNESLKTTHPVVFWNLIYYLRRLSLPSHLFSWIAERHHIRCVFDLPTQHDETRLPLYFYNPNHDGNAPSFGDFTEKITRKLEDGSDSTGYATWKTVTDSVNKNLLFKAVQTLVNSSRLVKNGSVHVGAHFPIFRDIQFASIDVFGRALLRDALDTQYDSESNKLPPKIKEILPLQDHPLSHVTRACRKVFMPLDLF